MPVLVFGGTIAKLFIATSITVKVYFQKNKNDLTLKVNLFKFKMVSKMLIKSVFLSVIYRCIIL